MDSDLRKMEAQSSTARVPSLDGLRAVSILMVVFSHAAGACGFPGVPSQVHWVFNGQLGVKIFFVISGFIITTLLLREEWVHGNFSIRKFYQRRILRIIPVYFIFLIAILMFVAWNNVPVSHSEFIAAFTFTTGWDDGTWLLGHTWSLAVEEQFYILWPLALYLAGNEKRRIRICVTVLAILPLLRVLVYLSPLSDRRPYLIITTGDGLMTGCLLAILFFYREKHVRRFFTSNAVIVRLLLVVILAGVDITQARMKLGVLTVPFANTIEALAIAWLVGSVILKRDWLFTALNTRIFVFLGFISYSWYLWQQVFLLPCERYFSSPLLGFPFNILASLIVAISSYFLIERTCDKLKRKWVL
jgi:peptidoglycan/LPS O-acetylase OafA/YrhL